MHKAAFLGPKGENALELERLLLEVLHDHVFWRRNYHPSDPRLIAERDKRTEAYEETAARLRDELFQILAELKRGAPLYSPRQIGHMVSDPTLPALIGYFAGLLYNQNNVVAEAAPETVRKERAYVAALARMVGYPPLLPERLPPEARRDRTPFSWGHLCGGGTLANLEALWVARNVRLYPLAVRLLAATAPPFAHFGALEVAMAGSARGRLGDLSTAELLNLPVSETTGLHRRLHAELERAGPETARAFEEALPSVRKTGLAGLLTAYNAAFPADPARPPVVLVSQAAHYGWAKAMDVAGLGAGALRKLPVDRRIRLDVDALAAEARACARRGEAVLMTVSIGGTTEEGAVDPLHRIEAARPSLAADGVTFWHHCDAAFGGYLATVLPRDAEGMPLAYDPAIEAVAALTEGLLDPEVYRALAALGRADSLTLDPHKFGYVPYPAGAVLFRDYHVRDAVSFAAPYLQTDEAAGFGGFLGQWTLEGSRPGAPAVSAYLSQAVVPLTEEGHGALAKGCLAATRALVAALRERFGEGAPVAFRPFAEPDTVGLCFALVPRAGASSLAALNAFTRRLWQRVSVDGREDVGQYAFILSKTEADVAAYRPQLAAMLGPGFADAPDDVAVLLLRVFVLNPFLHDWNERTPGFARLFGDFLYEVAEEVLTVQGDQTPPAPLQPDGAAPPVRTGL
jgi:glutamate/tyrosine decarboxylase-like PLP-dependent enzyme